MGLDDLTIRTYLERGEGGEEHLKKIEELFESQILKSDDKGQARHTFVEASPGFPETKMTSSELVDELSTKRGFLEVNPNGVEMMVRYKEADEIENSPYLALSSNRAYFKPVHNTDEELAANGRAVADTVEAVYEVLDPLFVWGYIPSPVGPWNPTLETTVERVTNGYVDALGWLTVFPPAAVERYGRQNLLSAPASGIRELDDGAIMLITGPTPTDFGAVEETAHEIADHLDMDLDPDALPGDFDER